MKNALLTAVCLLLTIKQGTSTGEVCDDLVNRIDREYNMEDVNACYECAGWNKIQSDTRSSYSSSLTPSPGAEMSRIGNPEGAWCAIEGADDYLEIKLSHKSKVAGVLIGGDKLTNSWVTSFVISYMDGNGEFKFVKDETGNRNTFEGNGNATSVEERRLPIPLETTVIRIHPTMSHVYACLQTDVYSCDEQESQDEPSMMMSKMMDYGRYHYRGSTCQVDVVKDCKPACLKYKIDWFGCDTCECLDMKEGEKFESDILLTPLTKAAVKANLGVSSGVLEAGVLKGASNRVPKWSDRGSGGKILVPYSYGAGLSSAAPAGIQAAIRELSSKTCIQLVRRSNQPQYINFVSRGGCSSPVGRMHNGNQVSIGYGCERMGTVVHEILHSLGFWHEQSRPDRDSYVQIRPQNIIRGMAYNFQKRQSHEIDSFGSPYDLTSVMHYHGTAFTSNGAATIVDMQGNTVRGQRGGLSAEDVKQINKMYKCGSTTGGGSTTKAPTTTRTTQPTGTCIDENQHCPAWARGGECDKNPGYMKFKCKKSCGVCGGSTCKDQDRRCSGWLRYCNSPVYGAFMKKNCAKTCNKC